MSHDELHRALDGSAAALEDLLSGLERLNFALLDLVPQERRTPRSEELLREEAARRTA